MQPITNALINTTRKASRLLQRDFFELEMLQSSSRGSLEFTQKSYYRTKELLKIELQKLPALTIFEDEIDKCNELVTNPTSQGGSNFILATPVDSISNLARSIPFFAIALTYVKGTDVGLVTTSTVLQFPALGEIYYAEKNSGMWLDKNSTQSSNGNLIRLRISGQNNLDKSLILTDDFSVISKSPNNVMNFRSPCYNASLVASGKSDILYLPTINYSLKYSFALMLKEAGGIISENIKEDFIATNRNLIEKFKQSLSKN